MQHPLSRLGRQQQCPLPQGCCKPDPPYPARAWGAENARRAIFKARDFLPAARGDSFWESGGDPRARARLHARGKGPGVALCRPGKGGASQPRGAEVGRPGPVWAPPPCLYARWGSPQRNRSPGGIPAGRDRKCPPQRQGPRSRYGPSYARGHLVQTQPPQLRAGSAPWEQLALLISYCGAEAQAGPRGPCVCFPGRHPRTSAGAPGSGESCGAPSCACSVHVCPLPSQPQPGPGQLCRRKLQFPATKELPNPAARCSGFGHCRWLLPLLEPKQPGAEAGQQLAPAPACTGVYSRVLRA